MCWSEEERGKVEAAFVKVKGEVVRQMARVLDNMDKIDKVYEDSKVSMVYKNIIGSQKL